MRLSDGSYYFDFASTTPVRDEVIEAMAPYWTELFGNPQSRHHVAGQQAHKGVEAAREALAGCVSARPEDVIFTGSATEANNLALMGLADALKASGRIHIITTAFEHNCCLQNIARLEAEGFEVTALPLQSDGILCRHRLRDALRADQTGLVCVMAVNNETGTIQRLEEIGSIIDEVAPDALFMSDAVQALGKIPLDMPQQRLDLVSLCAHKVYGPKGIGALIANDRARKMLAPRLHGSGQEGPGLRSGTLPPALCVGFGEAARLVIAESEAEQARLGQLRAEFLSVLDNTAPGYEVQGAGTLNIPGTLNLRWPGVEADWLINLTPDLCFSTGAACSGPAKGSHVIRAIRPETPEAALQSIRISFGHGTTAADLTALATRLGEANAAIQAELV
ncbi:MAG: IscS subfamily cysteine desulfurase [Alphaproteobacteria bacterium]